MVLLMAGSLDFFLFEFHACFLPVRLRVCFQRGSFIGSAFLFCAIKTVQMRRLVARCISDTSFTRPGIKAEVVAPISVKHPSNK